MASIEEIRDALNGKANQVLVQLTSQLVSKHYPNLNSSGDFPGTEDQIKRKLVTQLVRWCGDCAIKDELAVLIGLPPDADVMARYASESAASAQDAATNARRSNIIAFLALAVAIVALIQDSILEWIRQ